MRRVLVVYTASLRCPCNLTVRPSHTFQHCCTGKPRGVGYGGRFSRHRDWWVQNLKEVLQWKLCILVHCVRRYQTCMSETYTSAYICSALMKYVSDTLDALPWPFRVVTQETVEI